MQTNTNANIHRKTNINIYVFDIVPLIKRDPSWGETENANAKIFRKTTQTKPGKDVGALHQIIMIVAWVISGAWGVWAAFSCIGTFLVILGDDDDGDDDDVDDELDMQRCVWTVKQC